MDSRVGDGVEAAASIGPEFYNNPVHNFLYGDNGALKYTMPPGFQSEFAFAPQVDANAIAFHQQSPQSHLQYSPPPPSYSPQPNIRLQQQPHFDPYSQHLRQHVRQTPSTISPTQLQPQQAYNQPPLSWDELSTFTDAEHHPLHNVRRLQPVGTPTPESNASTPMHRTTVIAPPVEQTQSVVAQGFTPNSSSNGTPINAAPVNSTSNANYLPGCYWCTVEPESNVPEQWTENLLHFWKMKIEEAGNKPTKAQKRTSSQALPQSPIELGSDTKRVKVDKATKSTVVKKIPRATAPPLPADPIERLAEQVTRLMKSPDLSDATKFSNQFWDIMQEAGTDHEKRHAVVRTTMKEATPEIYATFAKNIIVPGRVQQWIAQIWNNDKNSPVLPLCIKIIRQLNLSTSELQATSLHKTMEFLRRKKAYPTISGLAESVLEEAERLEEQYAHEKKEAATTEEKASVKAPPASNAGLKRSRDDTDNGGKFDGSVKKPSVTPASSASKPATPAPTAKPPAPVSQVKPTPTNGTSASSTASSSVKPKPPTTTTASTASSFLKSIGNRTGAMAKPTTTTPAPSTRVQGYSSIFDQLRERQKKDEEEAALRLKTGKGPEKEEELTKKGKKKKTVRWKPEGELAQVTLFQVLEPIGEYYGGGDGRGHIFGDARSLDVEEGKDALAALKNRKALEEEDDLYIDWYQPIAIDFSELQASPDYDASSMSIRRGGTKPAESAQAEIQTKREAGILSVQYMTVREIPPSPEEPTGEPIDGAAGEWKQIPVPEHLKVDLKNPLSQQRPSQPAAPSFDLSSLLSQIQPQTQPIIPKPTPPPAPVDSIATILAQVQALTSAGSQSNQQAQPQAPMPQPQAQPDPAPPQQQPASTASNLLAILSTLSANNQQSQSQQQHTPTPPPPPSQLPPQLPPQPAPNTVTDFSQLWLQLAQQSQQQQQQQQPQPQPQAQPQPATQVTDLIAILTGQQQQQPQQQQQQQASIPPFPGLQIPGVNIPPAAAAWNQYAAWAAAAAAAATAAGNNNMLNMSNDQKNSSTADEFGRSADRNTNGNSSSGKDVRERLREQTGWAAEEVEAINGTGSAGRDHGGGGGNKDGKWSKKDKWNKKRKKELLRQQQAQQQQQHQQQHQQQQQQQQGVDKTASMCKFWGKGQCTIESCRYNHTGDDKYPADPSVVGAGGGGKRWKDKRRGGHGHGHGHGGHGHGGHHGGGGGGKLDAEAGRSEWVEGLEY